MKMLTLTVRNAKEILRDPLTIFFSLGFPVVLMLLLSAIQANIPVKLFQIHELAPGITIFGLSFMTLFAATLIARDRESALLQRLYTTPLTATDFIFGYILPILPIAVGQSVVCYIVALVLGLPMTITILYTIAFVIPISLLFIGLGLLCGSVFNVKQVGGFCGALLTNVVAWTSGIWFSLDLVGGVYRDISYALPFVHAVELEKAVLSANYTNITPHLFWVLGYTAIVIVFAIVFFLRQMRKQ